MPALVVPSLVNRAYVLDLTAERSLLRRWALTPDMPAYGSWGNGAPMRVSPVGHLARDEVQLLDLAAQSAAVSHDHPDAIAGGECTPSDIQVILGDLKKSYEELIDFTTAP